MAKKALKQNSKYGTGPYDSLRDYMEAIEAHGNVIRIKEIDQEAELINTNGEGIKELEPESLTNPVIFASGLATHENVASVDCENKDIDGVNSPEKTNESETVSTCAVGLTVIVKLSVGPSQLTPSFVNVGVTIMVATKGSVPSLAAVKLISPAPVSPAPISISEVQA